MLRMVLNDGLPEHTRRVQAITRIVFLRTRQTPQSYSFDWKRFWKAMKKAGIDPMRRSILRIFAKCIANKRFWKILERLVKAKSIPAPNAERRAEAHIALTAASRWRHTFSR